MRMQESLKEGAHNFRKQISHLISLIDPQFQMRRGKSMGRYGENVHVSFIYKPLIDYNQFWWLISLYFRQFRL